MNTKLLSPEPDPSIEDEEERNDTNAAKDIEQEIKCPRCYDVMTMSSNLDSKVVWLSIIFSQSSYLPTGILL